MNFIDKMVERFIKLNRRMKRWQRVVSVMAAVVVFATTYALVLPAITLDKDTATTQAGIEIAASENESDEAGTVFESEQTEEAEEPAAEEPAEEAVVEEPSEEDSSSESGSQEAEAAETEASAVDAVDEADAPETESADKSEQTNAQTSEEAAVYGTTEEAIAAVTGQTAEEVKLITEDTQLSYEADDYIVYADFGESAKLPEGVQLRVKEITRESDPEAYEAYYQKALSEMQDKYDENTKLSFAKFYDIAFVYDGVEIEPSGNVNVRIEYKQAVEIEKTTTVDTIHFDKNDEEKAEVINSDTEGTEKEVEAVEFESDRFSVYGVIGAEVIETTVLTADGSTYKITVDVSKTTNIPKGATLEAKEIAEGTDEYEEYFNKTAGEIDKDMTLSFARFFDIEIRANGEKIEPNAPVQISIEYLGGTDITGSVAIGVIHFAEDGTELIDEVTTDIKGSQMMSIEYTQDSLSVIGTIGTSGYTSLDSVADQMFVIYAQKENTPFALTHTYGDYYEGDDITTSSPSVLAGAFIDSLVVWHAEKVDGGYRIYYDDLDESARKHYLVVDENGTLGDSKTDLTVWSSESGYLKYQNGNNTGYLSHKDGSLMTTKSISSAVQIFYATVDVIDPYLNDGMGPVLRAANLRASNDAPAHSKRLIPNGQSDDNPDGDGTYTLALSVTGATSSSSTTEVTKANVVLVLDTSNSMYNNYTTYNGTRMRRLVAEKHVLADDGGIIDSLLAQNVAGDPVKSDIIEVALANFDTRGSTAQSFTTNATSLKSTINGLGHNSGTNWEEGLMRAKELADSIKASQPNEEVYVIFLTDGEPTTHNNSYNVNINYATEWGYARDNAREIVTAGYHFYGIFTWGTSTSSPYLSSLVNYAYTGTGNSGTALDPAYAQYFTDATDTEALIDALEQITHDITESVGYTNVELTDGVTEMTASNVKTTAGGAVTGLKYYRSGGSYSTTANDGLGEEWPDAPAATINDKGEVDWDLGNMTLENGVTYTVAFQVWPAQESIDLVADLNNGKKDYDSLPAEQKALVSVSGGKYYLKTNTDYPTVTYSTVTTTIIDGEATTVISDPKTENIPNPDPVGLYSEKLTVEKLWDDPTDDSQRPEAITLDLYKANAGVDEVYLEGITLNAANSWKLEDYASIAPGIMVSSDSPAYSTDYPQETFEGTTYAILETGHDYHFQENPMDYHFELTAYKYHPMLVDGVLYNVTFNEDGSIASMTAMSSMITATNTLKGRLYVAKEVSIPSGAIGYDLKTTTFPITVKLYDKDGEPLSSTGTVDGANGLIYRIVYGENHPNTDEGWTPYNPDYGNYGRSPQKDISGGTITESIYAGDQIYVGNLPTGATYEVTEGTLSSGWKLDKITYVDTQKKIAGNDEDQVTVNNTLPSFEVAVLKTDQGTTPLAGAVFSLYDSTYETQGTEATPLKTGLRSGTDGKFDLGVLSGGTYYLVETAAPDGYNKLTSAVKITVDGNSTKTKDGKPLYVTYVQEGNAQSSSDAGVTVEENDGNYKYTIQVTNNAGVELPMTGGPGTLLYTLSGLMLILVSALMYGFRMRRRERRLN